jgi:hypothetical protein
MYCNRHASICPPDDIYDPGDVYKDLLHLQQLGHRFSHVCLTGGEPTINPYLFEYITRIRSIVPWLSIFTNGKYLAHAPDEVLNKLKQYKVTLTVSVYPANIAYDTLFTRLDSKHIQYTKYSAVQGKRYGDGTKKYMMRKILLSETAQPLTFEECYARLHNCCELQHGILYKCSVMCNLKHIDAKYDTHFNKLLVEGEDYINVRTLTTHSTDIQHYTSRIPDTSILPFCKHCSAGYDHGIRGTYTKWEPSRRDRIEFIQE